jgi:hypothetical protein
MTAPTATVSLVVPRERENCATWLQSQPPPVVADLLECTEVLATTVSAASQQCSSEIVRSHIQEIQRLRESHDANLKAVVDEMRASVQAQAARETQLTLDDQMARHKSEVALLQTQVAAAREDVDRAHASFEERKSRLLEKHKREHADVVAELDSYKEQLKKLHADPLLERERETVQRVTAAFQQAEERLEQKCEARYAQQLADAKAEIEHLRSTTYGRVESLFGSLCGNSAKKGDIGEEFVAMVHSGMQLGTLTSTGRVQCPGYADHAWDYAPSKGPPIRGIVEVKFSQSADSKRDVQKFKDDVREAALTGRANVALYLSLTDRLSCCGKSKMCLEVLHGIPVLWAARDASDDLSAKTLVEMCFTVVAGVWAQISTMERDDANAVLYRIHGFLTSQVAEFEKMESQLKALDKANETIRVQTAQLRATRDQLLATSFQFRARHLAPTDELRDAQEQVQLTSAIRAFYDAKKRYPKAPSDLDGMGKVDPAVFEQAVKAIKEQSYRVAATNRAVKRKTAPEEGDDGGARPS